MRRGLHRILRRPLARFARNETASLTVEVMIMLPVLLWAFAGTFIFFDMFRENSVSEKAAYTVGDILSRETDAITPTYMDNTLTLFSTLSGIPSENIGLRVSVIRWDGDDEAYDLRWSQARGDADPLAARDVRAWEDVLPIMVDDEQIILVETFSRYTPFMDVGLGAMTLDTFVYTRPRFAPQLVWES